MNLGYFIPRVIRHFMPPSLARLMLRQKMIIKPGLETSDPGSAIKRYLVALSELNASVQGRRVLVLGYGGNFAVGCQLLALGAQHVVLCDPYAPPDHKRNQPLLQQYPQYLSVSGGQVFPNPLYLSLIEADIRQAAVQDALHPVDLVISSSVYEHLDDVEGITHALAQVTAPDGLGLHFIDLRDHFFRYPFEMLRYSAETWRGWLNPTSNLNRYRLWDYRRAFESCFQQVSIKIVERDEAQLEKIRPAIRAQFLSGDMEEDAATIIRVAVFAPKP